MIPTLLQQHQQQNQNNTKSRNNNFYTASSSFSPSASSLSSFFANSQSFSPSRYNNAIFKNLLVTASWDRTIRRWDAVRGAQKSEPLGGHTDSILSICLSPDGRVLASSSYDKTIRLWDVESWRELNGGEPLLGHDGKVWCVAFHPIQDETKDDDNNLTTGSGAILASCSEDETVRLWRVDTANNCTGSTIKINLKKPQEKIFAKADKDENLMQQMTQTAESSERFFQTLTLGSPVNYIAWSPTGSVLACALQNDLVRLFSVGVGDILIPQSTCRASFIKIRFGPKAKLVEFEDICGKKKAFDLNAAEKEVKQQRQQQEQAAKLKGQQQEKDDSVKVEDLH